MSARLLAIGLGVALASCGGGEALSPLGQGGAGGEAPDAGQGAAPPGPFKRTVMLRSPVGGPVDNLLVDGDFEMSLRPGSGGQYGWLAFGNGGSTARPILVETGGICRSGLRCPVLERNVIYFIRGAGAPGGARHAASLQARVPEDKPCSVVQAFAIACDTFEILKRLGTEPDVGPDGDRWCSYAATFGEQRGPVCMYVTAALSQGTTGLLDAAVVVPDDAGTQKASGEIWVPTAERWEQMQGVREAIRKGIPFDRGGAAREIATP